MTYTIGVWEIELTDEASEWILSLDQDDRAAITGSIDWVDQQWIQSRLRDITTWRSFARSAGTSVRFSVSIHVVQR